MKNFVFVIALVVTFFISPYASAEPTSGSAYDRVINTRTLHCGYNYYEPVIWRDVKTNEMKGIYVDLMDAIGQVTGLKIEWTAEVGWGDIPAALQAKKVDAFCAGTWADGRRGTQIAFTKPAFYNVIETYARANDSRFDKDLTLINDPKVTIASCDGCVYADIATNDFSRAKTLTVSQLSADSEILLNVATSKADVAFTTQGTALAFMKQNPGKLKRVAPDKPLRVFGVTTAVDIHEQELLSLLNAATTQLIDSGIVDKILAKYEKDSPGAFAHVTKAYQLSK